jgi:hypothetical protein
MKKHILIIFLATVVFICFHNLIKAQENDAELWSSIELKKKIGSKFKVSLKESLRFKENITRIKKGFAELGISYSINKFIATTLSYRYTKRQNIDFGYSNRHRLSVALSFNLKIDRFSLSYRTRFESRYIDVYSSDDGKVPERYNRNKFGIEYNIKGLKITPFAAYEFYYQLNNPQKNEIDKMRYTAGFEYKINKRNKIGLFYRIQQEINVNNPIRNYIIGVSYIYKLKKFKQKKKDEENSSDSLYKNAP